jgi:hypothetical protein
MAFQDSWQQQRQQRLQQVVQRRQAVSTLLQETQKQRQINASQLRSDLSLFRETLAYDSSIRRQNLQQFCETLQAQTQEFLAIAQAERSLTSQQLRHDLSEFRSTLAQTVKSLRQEIQADLQILQIETQVLLDFVEQLRSDVEAFLTDVALERQEKAAQAQRDRKAELEALFQKFAEFRSQLKQYRAELSQAVWSDTVEVAEPLPKPKPVIVMKKPEKRSRGFKVAIASKPEKALPSNEQRIYGYIEDMQSARLTEIESALSMTRIQAVEGLRSLIQQGKITQRDRVYLISK